MNPDKIIVGLGVGWGFPVGRGTDRGDDHGGKLERKGDLLIFTGRHLWKRLYPRGRGYKEGLEQGTGRKQVKL